MSLAIAPYEPLTDATLAVINDAARAIEPRPIARWLAEHGLTELGRSDDSTTDRFFDHLACEGLAFPDVARLFGPLRHRFANAEAGRLVVNLSDDETGRQAALRVAERLAGVGCVSAPALDGMRIRLVTNSKGASSRRRLAHFLQGPWLERAVRLVADGLFATSADVEVASNLKVVDEDGACYELDVVIADARAVTVVECKSGRQPEAELPRFRDVADAVGVDGAHAVFIAPQISVDAATDAGAFHRLTILDGGGVAAHLERAHRLPAPGPLAAGFAPLIAAGR